MSMSKIAVLILAIICEVKCQSGCQTNDENEMSLCMTTTTPDNSNSSSGLECLLPPVVTYSIIGGLGAFSLVTFTVGMVLGAACHRCYTRNEKKKEEQSRPSSYLPMDYGKAPSEKGNVMMMYEVPDTNNSFPDNQGGGGDSGTLARCIPPPPPPPPPPLPVSITREKITDKNASEGFRESAQKPQEIFSPQYQYNSKAKEDEEEDMYNNISSDPLPNAGTEDEDLYDDITVLTEHKQEQQQLQEKPMIPPALPVKRNTYPIINLERGAVTPEGNASSNAKRMLPQLPPMKEPVRIPPASLKMQTLPVHSSLHSLSEDLYDDTVDFQQAILFGVSKSLDMLNDFHEEQDAAASSLLYENTATVSKSLDLLNPLPGAQSEELYEEVEEATRSQHPQVRGIPSETYDYIVNTEISFQRPLSGGRVKNTSEELKARSLQKRQSKK